MREMKAKQHQIEQLVIVGVRLGKCRLEKLHVLVLKFNSRWSLND